MANICSQPLRKMPSAGLGNATAETLFQDSSSNPIILPLFPASRLKNRRFWLRAWGRVTTGATSTFTVRTYFTTQSATSATVPATSGRIQISTAVSLATLSRSFGIDVALVWDATSNTLEGWFEDFIGGTADSNTTITNIQSSIDPTLDVTANPGQGFVVSGVFGTGNASNTAFLDGFEIEV